MTDWKKFAEKLGAAYKAVIYHLIWSYIRVNCFLITHETEPLLVAAETLGEF
jgi:hypothetical protein